MKTKNFFSGFVALGLVFALGGCSSSDKRDKESNVPEFSSEGPTILNARSMPGVIELNRDFQPVRPAEVLVDVKDFEHEISDVRLRFKQIPLEVPMTRIGGTTWRAELSPRQLQQLAVSGRTLRYDADIWAKNNDGKTATSEKSLQLVVKAPDVSQTTG